MALYIFLLLCLVVILIFELLVRLSVFKGIKIERGQLVEYTGSVPIFFVMSVFFVLFLGLRGLTGSDTITYQNFYETGYFPGNIEKGYQFLSTFFSSHGLSFLTFELIIAIATLIPLFYVYSRLSFSLGTTMLFFYINCTLMYAMNVSRQILSASFFVLGVYFLQKKGKANLLVSVVAFIVACLMHQTAIIAIISLIPIYIIFLILRRGYGWTIFLGIMLIIFIIICYKTNVVYSELLKLGSSGSLSSYNGFITDPTAADQFTSEGKNLTNFIAALLEALVFFIPINKKTVEDRITMWLYAIFFFSIIVQASQVNWISERIVQFFVPFTAILVSRVLFADRKVTFSKIAFFSLLLVSGALVFVRIVIHNFGTIIPYLGKW